MRSRHWWGLWLALALALMAGFHTETLTSEAVLRWLHVFFGILWIGLLYYFNFVQIPTMPAVPAEVAQLASVPAPAPTVQLPAPVAGAVFGPGPALKPGEKICTTPTQSGANVNTDCETTAGPHNETSIAVNPTNELNLIGDWLFETLSERGVRR